MTKQRKRTNLNVPAKGRLRDMADQLWSLAVKEDWDHKCVACGHRGTLNSHHLIPRQFFSTRYDLQNGICMCGRCHQFCPNISPHQNAAGFLEWLDENWHAQFEWLKHMQYTKVYRTFNGTKNATYYCDTIRELKQYVDADDYTRIVGVKFSAWLEEN